MSFIRLDRIGPLGLLNLFKDQWLVSRQAAALFFLCTICVVRITPVFWGFDTPRNWFWTKTSPDILGALAAIGSLLLWLGMWRHWVRIDNSRRWMKRIWFVVLLIGFSWGSCLYYFFGYLPQFLRRRRMET